MERKPPFDQKPSPPMREGPNPWDPDHVEIKDTGTDINNAGVVEARTAENNPGIDAEPTVNTTGTNSVTPKNEVVETDTSVKNNTGAKRRGPKVRYHDHRRVELRLGPAHIATLERYRKNDDSVSGAARDILEMVDVNDAVEGAMGAMETTHPPSPTRFVVKGGS